MAGFMDLFGQLGPGAAGFPFGAGPSGFANDLQTGDLGGSQSWGKPPVPGVTGAAPEQLSAVNPGGADVPPPGLLAADLPAPGASPTNADGGGGPNSGFFIPPAPGTGAGPPASINETGKPPSMLSLPGQGPGGMTPGPIGGTAAPNGAVGPVGNGTGPTFAQASTTATSGPPPAPGGIPPQVKAEPGFLDKMKALSKDKDFMAQMGSAAGALKGSGKNPALDLNASQMSGFDPSAASRQGAAKLMEQILAKQKGAAGGVPQFPPGLLGR